MNNPTPFRSPVQFLAFGFGSGLSPRAPGTAGTLVAIPLYLLVAQWSLPLYSVFILATALAGIWICGEASRQLGVHDHGGIVWDEIAGMYLTLFLAPATPQGFLVAFLLFRVMDIVKPWPIRELDHRIHGGLGIMLDDLVAALYAALLLALYGWLMT